MAEKPNLQQLKGLWLIINNKVYDVSNFTSHPGGFEILQSHKGLDATSAFLKANHPPEVKSDLESYYLFDVPNITHEELAHHKSETDCWMALFGKVYDVTHFTSHPGGHEILIDHSGKDSTKAFEDIDHSLTAKSDLNKYFVGNFIPDPNAQPPKSSQSYLIVLAVVAAILAVLFRNFFLTS